MKLVEPVDPMPEPPAAAVRAALEPLALPAGTMAAMVRVFERFNSCDARASIGSNDLEHRIHCFTIWAHDAFGHHPEAPHAAILVLLSRLSLEGAGEIGAFKRQWGRRRAKLFRALLDEWLGDERPDLTPIVVGVAGKPEVDDPTFLCMLSRILVRRGLVDPAGIMSGEVMRAVGRANLSVPRDLVDLRRCDPWLFLLGPRALAHILPVIEREPDATLGQLLDAVRHAVGLWSFMAYRVHVSAEAPMWRRCTGTFARWAVRLHARSATRPDDVTILGAFWWAAWRVVQTNPALLDDATRAAACETARRALGKLRPLFRDAASRPDAAAEFLRGLLSYDEAVRVLAYAEGLWSALKPLLLALSSLSVLAVTPDLRYWNEGHRPPPEPWSFVPSRIATTIHLFAAAETVRDPGLQQFREEFGAFCLDRLRKKDGELVEPRAAWRQCMIRAFQELRVNPRGTAHHVLHRASQEDPDEDVKQAAAVAYRETRGRVILAPGVSPQRAIMTAFWWLRQAHLLALGWDLDPHGAQRTRQKETRRTTEEEVDPNETK